MPRDDGLFGGDVRAGLKQMREKLLDLTTRNRLLSFKHSPRSSIRIIDELPDILFDRLVNHDKNFSFVPVPRLSKRELWEYEADYRRDHGLTASDEVPQPDVRRIAIMRNLDTNFEMPLAADDDALAKHIDKKIQTLLYPEDLEASLNNLYRQARLGIEETGVNFLHMAIGFLEWDDQPASDRKHLAPLVLVPVKMERSGVDTALGIRQFSIAPSGEDIRDNLSLRMKLQEMGLALPSLEDGDGNIKAPEKFFTEFSGILTTKPAWKVRRYITLSVFQFGKMVMFEDLNPDRWGESLLKHPIVSKFFEGNPRKAESSTEVYEDLDAATNLKSFPIIENADSSQHSAVIDAMQGNNLVIEGPPGTGKSQTITNMIAACLNADKTVLFVSEKMAALEVVKRRLDGAGLGHFCLELHSHKTQKAQLIDEIRRRLELKGKFRHPRNIDLAIERLEATRQKIRDYSALLVRPWGNLGHSIQDIMAEAVRYRLRLACPPELIAEMDIGEPEAFGHTDLDDREMALKSFVAAFNKALTNVTSIKEHPFYGIGCFDLDELDFPKLWHALDEHIESIEFLDGLLARLPGLSTEEMPHKLDSVDALAELASVLPSPKADEIPGWFGALSDTESEAAFIQFVQDVERSHALLIQLKDFFEDPDAAKPEAINRLTELASQAGAAPLLELDGTALNTLIDQLATIAVTISQARTGLRKLGDILGAEIPATRRGIETASILLSLVNVAPHDHVHLRCDELRNSAVDAAISHAQEKIASIRTLEDDLSSRIELSIAPELSEAKRHFVTLKSAGTFGFLRGEVRQSKRVVRSIWVGPQKPTRAEQISTLRRLIQFREQVSALAHDQAVVGAFGRHFAGTDTPVEGLKVVREWYLNLVAKLAWSDSGGVSLPDRIWRIETSDIGLLKEQAIAKGSEIACIHQLAESFHCTPLTQVDAGGSIMELTTLRRSVDHLLDVARQLQDVRDAIRVKREVVCRTAVNAIRFWHERMEAALRVEANAVVKNLLGDDFRGTMTDLQPLQRALSVSEAVRHSGLPESMTHELLSQNSAERFHGLKLKLRDLKTAIERALTNIATLTNVAGLDPEAWLEGPFETSPLEDVLARARQVPQDNGLLRDWVDYLRLSRRLGQFGLEQIVNIVRQAKLQPGEVEVIDAFRSRLYDAMARALLETHDELREFRSDDFERLRERYVELDLALLDLQRARIAAKVDRRMVPAGVSSGRVRDLTEQALLDHIKNQARPRVAVRQILHRAGNALQALKPCFMMGPLSVAQYLDPRGVEFDLVVMDEASQMKPEDAMGAIARGKQIVIVGDSKQLPPTSFFDRLFKEESDDEEAYVAV